MRKATRGALLACSLALLASACATGVNWRRHLALRAYGEGLALSEIDPKEALQAAVRPNLDYVSVSVERVFFKDVPVALTGAVAVGLEVLGLTPGEKPVKTVLGVKTVGLDRTVYFNEAIVLQPTLYTGKEVQITLYFRRVPTKVMPAVMGALQGVSNLLRKLDPAIPETLEQPLRIYQQVIEGTQTSKEPIWKYQTTFASMSVMRDKPDRILTAARHILILLPAKGAGGAWGKLRISQLPKFLKMEGNRLVWRHTGNDYEATPHIILNVRRYRRYPRETEADKQLRRADVLYEQGPAQGFFTLGRIALMTAAEALVNDRVLTVPEKNLYREWIQYRHRRFDAEESRVKNDKKGQLENLYREVRALGVIRQEFQKILYQAEVKDIEYKVTSLARTIQDVAKELGEEPKKLDELLEIYKLKERVHELLKVQYRDRVIRVHGAKAEQFGASSKDRSVLSAGTPDPKIIDIAASALAQPPDVKELEGGVSPPIYKRWWFWTLVGLGVSGAAAGLTLGLRSDYRGGGSVTGPIAPLPQLLRWR